MIVFLFCLLLMVAAPVSHIILCSLHLAARVRMSITLITLLCILAGLVLPTLASYIDLVNLPSDIKCATGAVGFAMLGMMLTIVVIPVSAIIFYIISYYKNKKLKMAA